MANLVQNKGRVNIKCSACGKELNPKIGDYKKCVKEDGSYFCSQCAKNHFQKFISFYEWCYINLLKEDADVLLSRWDYELNVDKLGNTISPKNISHGSNKLYWFKCLKHIEHESELKNINTFTNGKQTNIDCIQCNSIETNYPHLIQYLVNKEDSKRAIGSTYKILIKCPACGHIKEKSIYDWLNNGFGCPKCSDGVSYPEKFLFNVFEQLNADFQIQISRTIFNWCNDYRYDFYINKINSIIETHGMQHYKEKENHWSSLKEIQDNDEHKEKLAKQNGIKNYIILDCKNSTTEWIKDSIMQSNLPQLLQFEEFDIDWLKCHEYACSSLVKEVCKLWTNGVKNLQLIADKLKINPASVRNYLKQGEIIGWCNYNAREVLKDKTYLNIPVICLTTGEVFDSIISAGSTYNIHRSSISASCHTKINCSAGRHPINGERMIWMYYSDYLNTTEEQINKVLNSGYRKVICINTGEVFNSNAEAAIFYNINKSSISSCCTGKLSTAGKHPTSGEKLKWEYYNDSYFKKQERKQN